MKLIIAALILLTLTTPAWAGFDEGEKAFLGKDYSTALRELKPLAKQGNATAQYYLGAMYERGGFGVPQDYAEAVKWWRRAAEQGDADAQQSLGAMYGNGWGVPQDYVQAHKWLNLAVAQGYARGKKTRDDVAKKMTPAQIAEAQKLAREWWKAFQKRKGK